ncbi:MAG: hypothetical protein KC983_12065, partial [Phycisphaerales bacterium]|nr:hypothetical protein [Phycisphaerales bacterium]
MNYLTRPRRRRLAIAAIIMFSVIFAAFLWGPAGETFMSMASGGSRGEHWFGVFEYAQWWWAMDRKGVVHTELQLRPWRVAATVGMTILWIILARIAYRMMINNGRSAYLCDECGYDL